MSLIAWPTSSANAYYAVATAQAYFDNRLDVAEWTSATTAEKEASLIMAAAIIDRQKYLGTKSSDGYPREWGRDTITDKYGDAVANNILPPDFNLANFEMALAILKDNTVQTQTDSGSNIRKLEAGSASIEYFHSTSENSLPEVVSKYLQPYIDGYSDFNLSYSYGTANTTGVEVYGRSRGFA